MDAFRVSCSTLGKSLSTFSTHQFHSIATSSLRLHALPMNQLPPTFLYKASHSAMLVVTRLCSTVMVSRNTFVRSCCCHESSCLLASLRRFWLFPRCFFFFFPYGVSLRVLQVKRVHTVCPWVGTANAGKIWRLPVKSDRSSFIFHLFHVFIFSFFPSLAFSLSCLDFSCLETGDAVVKPSAEPCATRAALATRMSEEPVLLLTHLRKESPRSACETFT